jgi:hypothetical protein
MVCVDASWMSEGMGGVFRMFRLLPVDFIGEFE